MKVKNVSITINLITDDLQAIARIASDIERTVVAIDPNADIQLTTSNKEDAKKTNETQDA
tara:strand:- start:1148 stop:1327 length:180 start_codon:yes stop_codon:yes gene_type:complete